MTDKKTMKELGCKILKLLAEEAEKSGLSNAEIFGILEGVKFAFAQRRASELTIVKL